MSSTYNVNPVPATLPQGVCNLMTDWQSILNTLCAYMNVPLPLNATGVVSSVLPPTYNANAPTAWLQLDSPTLRPVRLYFFAQGYWLSPHAMPAKSIIWTDQPVSTNVIGSSIYCNFDGGDHTVAPTLYTGPFWEVVYGGLFPVPVVVGNMPASYTQLAALALAATGGEERHVLTDPETAPHTHLLANSTIGDVNGPRLVPGQYLNTAGEHASSSSVEYNLQSSTTFPTLAKVGEACGDPTTGTPPVSAVPHNNLPPYIALYLLRRTIRQFYSVSP